MNYEATDPNPTNFPTNADKADRSASPFGKTALEDSPSNHYHDLGLKVSTARRAHVKYDRQRIFGTKQPDFKFLPSYGPATAITFVSMIAILFSIFTYDATTSFPGLAAIIPCLGTAIILAIHHHTDTPLRRFLSAPPRRPEAG